MPTFAFAFHENAAMDELRRFFSESESSEAAGTYPAICSGCRLGFALVVLNRHDPACGAHRAALTALIERDCAGGIHQRTYALHDD